MRCRHCQSTNLSPVIDLGFAPPSNAYLSPEDLNRPELHYPLRCNVCLDCWLVQTEDYAESGELFSEDYAYFSSVSQGWLEHARIYSKQITTRLNLGKESLVVELASNDGYLLKNFVATEIPCLGVEPTVSTASAAEKLGIPVIREFFGRELALKMRENGQIADLIIGNNVYAHVPDINDFTAGISELLAPEGVVTLEFPHLGQLLKNNQFDTIYHEHFSYFSLGTVQKIFASQGLRVWDVELLTTHGGSLRVYGCLSDAQFSTAAAVDEILQSETQQGLFELSTYKDFAACAERIKDDFLKLLLDCKRDGKKLCAYGAAAKGNTLINYAGIGPDLLPFVCDAAESKQGKLLPGSHIPIRPPEAMLAYEPDIVVVLPWNILDEVQTQMSQVRERGGKFAVAIPELRFV